VGFKTEKGENVAADDIRFADRLTGFGRETGFEIKQKAMALESRGIDVVHLEVGEPDFPTPQNIIAAAKGALDAGQTHYAPSAGLPALREAVAEHVTRMYSTPVRAAEVVIAPGAKPLIFFSFQALVNPGELVLIPDINFPAYEAAAMIVGARIETYPLLPGKGFRPDLDWLADKAASDKVRMLVTNSPHNPTGGMFTGEDYAGIAELSEKHGFWVLSDEVYSSIVYDEPHVSALASPALKPRLIMVDGWSKTFAMTGWRLGYGVVPEMLARKLATLTTNSNSCTCTFNQYGALEAISNPESWDAVERMRQEFAARRAYLIPALRRLGCLKVSEPKGAFYAFADLSSLGMPSKEINDRLLEEAHIAALHGTAFGVAGEGYIRFSFANSLVNLQSFVDRLTAWVAKYCQECG
jgi:aspartate aminotransferase